MAQSYQTNDRIEVRAGQARRERPGLFWPLVLITIGIVFLLRNTGWLGGDAWDLFVRLWPVLLIIMGVDGLFQRHGLVGPFFLIALGAAFLTSTLQLLDWDAWAVALKLWPLLLVAIGLDMLVARRSALGAVFSAVLMLALLAGALWFILSGAAGSRAQAGYMVSQEIGTAESVDVMLDPAFSFLNISALDDAGKRLVAGELSAGKDVQIEQVYTPGSGGNADFRLSAEGTWMVGDDWTWDLAFNPGLPLRLDVNMGMGEAYLDLMNLNVTQIDLDMGLGKVTLIVPAKGEVAANVNGAIGELVVIVPYGVEVDIQAEQALAGLRIPEMYTEIEDGHYQSAGYDEAENRLSLVLKQAIGMVTISGVETR